MLHLPTNTAINGSKATEVEQITLKQIADYPDCLSSLSVGKLKGLWQLHFPLKVLPPTPSLLLHEIAFAAQAKVHGGLDSETALLLKQLVRGNEVEFTEKAASKSAPIPTGSKKLQSGTRLVRHWHGHDHEVTMIDGSYHYHGKEYRSLTQIAKLITGTHWSGPRFFGVNKLHSSL